MLSQFVLALGLLFAIEGLLVAVAPKYLEKLIKILLSTSSEKRRLIGLITLAFGTFLIWVAKTIN
tara:strand:+ start:529 stop:723 length:195 start_codon:yes stop_codon:yes gene_type:complete